MSGGHYENIKNANLFDCLDISQIRLVPAKLRNVPIGYSEVPLIFHLKPETVKSCRLKFRGAALYTDLPIHRSESNKSSVLVPA